MNETPAYQIKVNGVQRPVTAEDLAAADIVQKSVTELHVIHQNRSVNTRLLAIDPSGKKMEVEVDGELFNIVIQDPFDQMLDRMGFSKTVTKQIKQIKAPMPGMVLEVAVSAGDVVKEGDKLLILGAMKMENSILVPADAVIKRVCVNVSEAVDKGQLLIELE